LQLIPGRHSGSILQLGLALLAYTAMVGAFTYLKMAVAIGARSSIAIGTFMTSSSIRLIPVCSTRLDSSLLHGIRLIAGNIGLGSPGSISNGRIV